MAYVEFELAFYDVIVQFISYLATKTFPFLRRVTTWVKKKHPKVWMNYHHHYHHHVAPSARTSLTLSYHPSLSSRSSGIHPVSAQSCCMYVLAGRPAFARPCDGVHRSTSLMSSSLLFQQYPACLVWELSWWVVSGRTVTAFWVATPMTCSILLPAFLCSCCQAFSPYV